jgi:formylglycine-generating enzyme required for sulfatase activity
MRRLFVLAALLFALPAHAVTIEWVTVGDPGNDCDVQPQGCFGSVNYVYRIGKYEVTNAQYAEFLNAVARTGNPYSLYSTEMGSGKGGITRSGRSGSYTYSVIPGRGSMPVNYVDLFDALRFANWLHNGEGAGSTETGAYTLLGGTPLQVTRTADATVFLTSEDEWYKAAYYDSVSASYFDFPAGENTQTTCATPGPTANTANCWPAVQDLTDVGSYSGSASPYGTFDQGGNVWEQNEAIISGAYRGLRGGSYTYDPPYLAASYRLDYHYPTGTSSYTGFRVAMIPEPSTALLLACGLAGFAAARQRRSQRLHRRRLWMAQR